MASLLATFVQYFRPYQKTPLLRIVKVDFAYSKGHNLVRDCGVILCSRNIENGKLACNIRSVFPPVPKDNKFAFSKQIFNLLNV